MPYAIWAIWRQLSAQRRQAAAQSSICWSPPAGATTATVLTDTNCAPDADGISHCLKDLQIGEAVVTVQHHHATAEIPCLSPGETVTLMPFEEYEAAL